MVLLFFPSLTPLTPTVLTLPIGHITMMWIWKPMIMSLHLKEGMSVVTKEVLGVQGPLTPRRSLSHP